jgi:hypothetical protein
MGALSFWNRSCTTVGAIAGDALRGAGFFFGVFFAATSAKRTAALEVGATREGLR